jgi:hypothetical protein
MKMQALKKLGFIVILLIGCSTIANAGVIGKTIFVRGVVRAFLSGKVRRLLRGSVLFAGDEVKTGPSGKVKLRFSDGSIVDLTTHTDYKVKGYSFNADAKENNYFLAKLYKGQHATITGNIVRLNRAGYHVEVGPKHEEPVAIIAVRGTAYYIKYLPKKHYLKLILKQGKLTINGVLISERETAILHTKTKKLKIIASNGVVRKTVSVSVPYTLHQSEQ